MRRFASVDEVLNAVGEDLGYSAWREVTQSQIDQFADATGDHQWIHVDPRRAAAGPFGATILHGWMTLALVAGLEEELYQVDNVARSINVGANRVRFLRPILVDSRVRLGAVLSEVTRRDDGVRTVMSMTIEVEGSDAPACVAEVVSLLIADDGSAEAS